MTQVSVLDIAIFDAPDIEKEGRFYAELTGWDVVRQDAERSGLRAPNGQEIEFQRAPDHVAPRWPGQELPQQFHLDLQVADPKAQAELIRQWRELDKTEHMWSTTFEQYVAALLHVIEVAGVDHVCFGADWDGGGGIAGLEDITALPTVTARLLAAGYSRDDINKMTSGNVLRILGQAQAAAGH